MGESGFQYIGHGLWWYGYGGDTGFTMTSFGFDHTSCSGVGNSTEKLSAQRPVCFCGYLATLEQWLMMCAFTVARLDPKGLEAYAWN